MEKYQTLIEFLEKHRGERHLVVLHDYPDPDAISSAFAYRLIAEHFEIESDIVYTGKISHSQNIALVKLAGIDLQPFSEALDLGRYAGAVFLDNQGTTVNGVLKSLETAGVPVRVVIDHHEPQGTLDAEFSDIQKTGSTATIFSGYIQQGLVELKKDRKDHVAIATALLHGILTDTAGFTRAASDDFHAAAYLSGFRDADMLGQIMNQSHSKQVMDIIRQALGNRMIIENLSVAGIGYVRAEDRDAIPQAAEFLMNEENVHTAIVYGILKEENQKEVLAGSLRTSKWTFDPDEFLKTTFGMSPDGHYFGGGKHTAGGFSIPVGFLAGEPCADYAELKWKVFDAQVKARIFDKLGVKPDLHHEQHKLASGG